MRPGSRMLHLIELKCEWPPGVRSCLSGRGRSRDLEETVMGIKTGVCSSLPWLPPLRAGWPRRGWTSSLGPTCTPWSPLCHFLGASLTSGSSPAQQTAGREAGPSGGSRVGYGSGPYAAAQFPAYPVGSAYPGTSPTHNKKRHFELSFLISRVSLSSKGTLWDRSVCGGGEPVALVWQDCCIPEFLRHLHRFSCKPLTMVFSYFFLLVF